MKKAASRSTKTKPAKPAAKPAKAEPRKVTPTVKTEQHPMGAKAPYERRYKNGALLCNAKNNTCGANACDGRTKCRNHGGESLPAGPTHPTYKHGRRSKFIPSRLGDKYTEALQDSELMEYRQDVAMLESRLAELLESGESELLWGKAQAAFNAYRKAQREAAALSGIENKKVERAQKVALMQSYLDELGNIIDRGKEDVMRWADIYRVTEQQGRTKERENKRLVQMQQMVSMEQLMALFGQIAEDARRTITNKDDLFAFATALSKYGTVAFRGDATAGH